MKIHAKWPVCHTGRRVSPPPQCPPEPPKTPEARKSFFLHNFDFGPLLVHIGHLGVLFDQFYIEWPIKRPKNRCQAEILRISIFLILADFDNFWAFSSNEDPKVYLNRYLVARVRCHISRYMTGVLI